jgi:type IV pilus assembly protein PilM
VLRLKFDFFKDKSVPVIGLDISSSAVKMVELVETSPQNFRLESYSTTAIPADAVVDGNIIKLEHVVDAIAQGWKALGTSEKHVALALPASAVITKKVAMAHGLSEDEMELQVQLEANQFVPFSLDEVNVDFYAADDAPNHHNEIEVLIAAARKEKIEDRVAAAEGAGLKAVVMDIDYYAMEAALTLAPGLLINHGRNQTLMMVDIGANTLKINILHDHISVYMREQAFGGAKLTQEIKQRFGLSGEDAEQAKKSGTLPDNYITEVQQPFLHSLAMEIHRAIQLFTNATQYSRVDQIVLVGGCAAMPGIQRVVADSTQISTLIYNPFNNMALAPRIKQTQLFQDAPSLMVACGLAMRGFE